MKLDAATGKHTEYKPLTTKQATYGLAVDADDNIWMAQPCGDRLMYVENKTGKVGEVLFEPRREPWVTPKDVRIAQTMQGNVNFGWPHQKGPRRLGADRRGTTLWVAHFKSDQLAKVDIRSKRVEKEYPVPTKYSGPYGTEVDKNHMVWVQMLNGDRIGKFDPKTERWVEYQLPTRNTQMRHLTVDNRTAPHRLGPLRRDEQDNADADEDDLGLQWQKVTRGRLDRIRPAALRPRKPRRCGRQRSAEESSLRDSGEQ